MRKEKILIIAPSWLGDTIMAQSLFKVLAAQGKILHVLAPSWSFGILQRMPEVAKSICVPLQHGKLALRERYIIGRELRQENYHEAIVLPNSFKSALIPVFAKIKRRTGWLGEQRRGLLNNILHQPQRYARLVERYVALAYAGVGNGTWDPASLPEPRLQISDPQTIQATCASFQLNRQTPILALAPGAAYGATKRWPVEYYAQIAQKKLQEGWQVWLFGSNEEAAMTKLINDQLQGAGKDLAGKLKLTEVVDLLAQARVVVSNDSGLMHLAAAVAVPVIGIYGATLPSFAPPLAEKARIFSESLACKPCAKRSCPFEHYACLRQITPERVLAAIEDLSVSYAYSDR